MTDFDADEPVAPLKKKVQRRFWTSDRIIGYSGVALALSAAFFPWYVFFNGVRSGTDITASFLARNLPDWAGQGFFRDSPNASVSDRATDSDRLATPGLQEQIITGTVPNAEKAGGEKEGDDAVAQPFPAQPMRFHLLHVSKGKALIEDDNGVYIVQTGSLLPDLSKVASLEERDGQWVLVTDKGDIYDAGGKRR